MITRVTLALDPVDVDLIDRLARVQGLNRSEQVRELLGELRPTLRQAVETLEAALRQRDEFLALVAEGEVVGLAELLPEVNRVHDTVVGAMARLEGALAVRAAADPRLSNHGGQVSTPEAEDTTE